MGLTGLASLFGCATPNSVVYSSVNVPPRAFARRSPADVDVFVGKPPFRPYVDVGMLEVYQGRDDDGTGHSTEDMLRTLRLHAALRGCDALQVMGVELAGKFSSRIVRGVCEMYTDSQAQEEDKHLTSERLPGEGQPCATAPRPTTSPSTCPGLDCAAAAIGPSAADRCPDPLVCLNSVCASPYQ